MEKVDATLLCQARQGESNALSILYRRFLPVVFGYLALRLPDRTTAEDATAEVFMHMVSGIQRVKATDEAGFSAWLLRIARTTVAQYYCTRARQPAQVSIASREATLLSTLPDDLAQQMETQETWHMVVQAMNCLTETQRLVLVGRFLLGYDTAQIARLIGKKPNAVKALQFRALQRLRQVLGPAASPLPWAGHVQPIP